MLAPARLAILSALICPTLFAQSSQHEIEARVLRKPLYLLGRWQGNNLHFDASGNLLGTQSKESFTLSGINVTKVILKPDRLILEAQRVGVQFQNYQARRVDLDHTDIHIEIDNASDFNPALTAIFADSLSDLVPSLPPYWQAFARAHLQSITQPTTGGTPVLLPSDVLSVGGNVTAPVLLHSAEPVFSEAARHLHYSAITLIHVILDEQGQIIDMQVLQAAGLGLDEQAMACILHYKFKPAMEDGHPVRVVINVNVNFRTT